MDGNKRVHQWFSLIGVRSATLCDGVEQEDWVTMYHGLRDADGGANELFLTKISKGLVKRGCRSG